MKRIIYVAILALSFLAPLDRADIAKLEPIETVALDKIGDQIIIMTDTEQCGIGYSVKVALTDLHKNATKVLYLDTAKYLLVTNNAIEEVSHLRSELKGSTRICLWQGGVSIKDVTDYLSIHHELPKLKEWKAGDRIPIYYSNK